MTRVSVSVCSMTTQTACLPIASDVFELYTSPPKTVYNMAHEATLLDLKLVPATLLLLAWRSTSAELAAKHGNGDAGIGLYLKRDLMMMSDGKAADAGR